MRNRDTSFDLARRRFGQMAVAGALGGYSLRAAPEVGLGRPPMKWGIKHSMQLSSLQDEDLQLARQLGMEWVNLWSSPGKYKEIVARVEAAGLKVAKIGNGSVHNQAAITLNLPGRDAKIEEFKQNLRSLAAAGIKYQLYAHMANGVWSSVSETTRGGAGTRAFRVGAPSTSGGSSHNMSFERRYSEEELWENYTYFIKRIVPVAEETGVKIGVHPDDPPGLTLGNVPRPVFSSFEGYRRALEIADSPNVGMGLCTGCWLEGGPAMGRNVLETIEYFGRLKKLFVVHFRNVHQPLWTMPQSPGTPGGISFSLSRAVVDSGPDKLKLIPHGTQRLPETEALPLPYFHETFLNEGYMDMYKIMRQLRQVNFDGVLIADHWPRMLGGPRAGQIYSIAYLQALIERANEEVSA